MTTTWRDEDTDPAPHDTPIWTWNDYTETIVLALPGAVDDDEGGWVESGDPDVEAGFRWWLPVNAIPRPPGASA